MPLVRRHDSIANYWIIAGEKCTNAVEALFGKKQIELTRRALTRRGSDAAIITKAGERAYRQWSEKFEAAEARKATAKREAAAEREIRVAKKERKHDLKVACDLMERHLEPSAIGPALVSSTWAAMQIDIADVIAKVRGSKQ